MANGIYTNIEFIDTIIEDLNECTKQLVVGNYVGWCGRTVQVVQKLNALKQGITNDMQSKDKAIETLKQSLRDRGAEIVDVTPEQIKDGGQNGSN